MKPLLSPMKFQEARTCGGGGTGVRGQKPGHREKRPPSFLSLKSQGTEEIFTLKLRNFHRIGHGPEKSRDLSLHAGPHRTERELHHNRPSIFTFRTTQTVGVFCGNFSSTPSISHRNLFSDSSSPAKSVPVAHAAKLITSQLVKYCGNSTRPRAHIRPHDCWMKVLGLPFSTSAE